VEKSFHPHLTHIFEDGAVYFVTSSTVNRLPLPPPARKKILEVIIHPADGLYEIFAVCVMPDHFHAILQPCRMENREWAKLDKVMFRIKGASARYANGIMERTGALWERGYFNRIIKKENDYSTSMNYLVMNPVKAGLAPRPEDYEFTWIVGMEK